jgi:hypothetical protein
MLTVSTWSVYVPAAATSSSVCSVVIVAVCVPVASAVTAV